MDMNKYLIVVFCMLTGCVTTMPVEAANAIPVRIIVDHQLNILELTGEDVCSSKKSIIHYRNNNQIGVLLLECNKNFVKLIDFKLKNTFNCVGEKEYDEYTPIEQNIELGEDLSFYVNSTLNSSISIRAPSV